MTTCCHEWMAGKTDKGYGAVWINGSSQTAHRVAFAIHFGLVQEAMLVCHHCDNPLCVNPSHLFLGTASDNVQDCLSKGRGNPAIGDRNGSRLHPQSRPRGERHVKSKLTVHQVLAIRKQYASGDGSFRSIAKSYGMSKSTIYDIVNNKRWGHIA